MDRYLHVKSNESDNYFLQNEAFNFKVHLKVPLLFSGFWTVGLVEFHAKRSKARTTKGDQTIYIFSNICKDSIVNGVE